MLQIVEDLTPKAQLGFATAFNGYIDFANNIRALKDVFGADVICDDVYYYAEPMFQDGPIGQAVDYVASKGVAYFSAAGNVPGVQAYDAEFKLVRFDPANPQAALKGTNINLNGVDPSLYAGGFHNFRTDGGQDIAQQCAPGDVFGANAIDFQWNDPYAYTKQSIGKLLLNKTGELTSASSSVTFNLEMASANTLVRLEAGPTVSGGTDVVVAILDPQGTVLVSAYSNQTPTEVALPAAGKYSVVVTADTQLVGAFYVKINQVNVSPAPEITSNFNLLLFDVNGTFLTAISEDAFATKQPILLQAFEYPFNFQLVIARSTIPTVAHPADRIRYLALGFEVLNYGSYLSPASFGHNCAAGANGVAAYSAFRPFAPEPYTSPGPTTIYFDTDNNRLSKPEVRMRPNFAGMDGAYTTFFGSTTTQDASSFPNFFGTSAATPHAAAIAALVLQAHGGSGSVTPEQMTSVLERSTFPHSLTPYYAFGRAAAGGRTVTIQAAADYSDIGEINPNQFTVRMSGRGSISSLSINLQGADPTGGNIYQGYPGEVFTAPTTLGGYPFTISSTSQGISTSDVKASYGEQAPAPSITGEFYQLNLAFAPGKLNQKATLRFGIGHLEQHSSYFASQTGTGGGDSSGGGAADLFGQGILIPSGTLVGPGATFFGVFDDGTSFSGTFTNQIGSGWTPLDGYGFINAQKAVEAPLK
ncbi:MAG: S8 family serine peptidase [Verrucomicrobia bacterium]|nr:S8 family serine peptidase [Verrucomicrobiota bacterium]